MSELMYRVSEDMMNLGVSSDSRYLFGDTNNSMDFRTFKIELPVGSWVLEHRVHEVVHIMRKVAKE